MSSHSRGGGHYSHYYVSEVATGGGAPSRAKSTEKISAHNFPKRLTEADRGKIEMFYRSHKTFIYVGNCLANLYFTDTELVDGGRRSRPLREDWKLTLTGVPLLLFNKGDTKSRDKRQLRICLAQPGTGFPLWSDIIDNLSDFRADAGGSAPTFQTMYYSCDHRKMAGFSFDCPQAASDFLHQVETIVSNPLNISLTGPKKKSTLRIFSRRRSKSVGRLDKAEALDWIGGDVEASPGKKGSTQKADISSPCLFQHITTVNIFNCDASTLALMQRQAAPPPPPPSSIDSPVYSTPEPMDTTSSSTSSSTSSMLAAYGKRRLAPPIPLDRATSFNEIIPATPTRHFTSCSNASHFSY